MPFGNPVVGGTALVRTAINSPNFVPGSTGWSINRDGSAEFSAAVIRGEVDVGPASPNPHIVITKNIPATLVAASTDFAWSAGSFRYISATDYEFDAVGTYLPGPLEVYAQGTYDTTHGVMFNVLLQGLSTGGYFYLYGSNTYNGFPIGWAYRNGTVGVDSGANSRFLVSNETVATRTGDAFGTFTGTGTASSPSYADVPNLPADHNTFVKKYDNTDIEIHLHMTCFADSAAGIVKMGVRVVGPAGSSGDKDVGQLLFNNASVHLQVSGSRNLGFTGGGNPAGTYTIIPRWASTGVGNIKHDTNDYISWFVREVAGEFHV